jgi:uncharacterized integral membrane protein
LLWQQWEEIMKKILLLLLICVFALVVSNASRTAYAANQGMVSVDDPIPPPPPDSFGK